MTFSEIVHWPEIEFNWVTVAQTTMKNNLRLPSSPLSKSCEIGMNEQIVVTFGVHALLSNYASVWNINHTLPQTNLNKKCVNELLAELSADYNTDFVNPCPSSWISAAQQVENEHDVWGPPRAAECRRSFRANASWADKTLREADRLKPEVVSLFPWLDYCFSTLWSKHLNHIKDRSTDMEATHCMTELILQDIFFFECYYENNNISARGKRHNVIFSLALKKPISFVF